MHDDGMKSNTISNSSAIVDQATTSAAEAEGETAIATEPPPLSFPFATVVGRPLDMSPHFFGVQTK